MAVPSTQEEKQKKEQKRSQPPAPVRPYARRDAPLRKQESHTFPAVRMQLKQTKVNKAFENNIIVSSLQRDPARSLPQGLSLFVHAFVVFS